DEAVEQLVNRCRQLRRRRFELNRKLFDDSGSIGSLLQKIPDSGSGEIELVDAVGAERDEDSGIAQLTRDHIGGRRHTAASCGRPTFSDTLRFFRHYLPL